MTKSPIPAADRVATVSEYYLQRKLQEVAAMRSRGIDVVSLGIGGPDMPPSLDVINELRSQSLNTDAHGYQLTAGLAELRQEWTNWYRRHYNVALDPNSEIQPLTGSKEGVMQLSLSLLNPGDGVLIPNPGYPTYTSASRLAGAEIYPYSLTEANGWQPNFEQLEQMPLERIKVMWVNYPHMPTGARASMALFDKLVEFAHRHSILLIHDNPYSFILNDHPLSLLAADGAKEVAVEMNSLSKSHNMAGWRMGVAVGNTEVIGWLRKVRSNMDSGQFRPAMLAAVQALQAPQQWYDQLNAAYAARRVIAEQIMTALGCKFDPQQRGLFLWGRVPESVTDTEAFCDNLLAMSHVFITPGFIFGSEGQNYIRISLCANEAALTEALNRIKTTQNNG
jgi:aspartate/methionine/tyrosine aminotransferase